MDKKVIVVGIGGVGMAHVCAIVRTGGRVIAMIDTNRHILLQAYEKGWANQWDDKTEWVEQQAGCLYADNLLEPEIMALQPDIVTICVPPHALMPLAIQAASLFPNALILVEKPVWEYKALIAEIGDRLRMSSEYVYYPEMLAAIQTSNHIVGFYGDLTNHTRWGYRISMAHDFLPHVVGLLSAAFGEVLDYGWMDYKVSTDVFSGILQYGAKKFRIRAVRSPELPFEIIVGGSRFSWKEDLFDRQYQSETYGVTAWAIRAAMEIANFESAW